jgi:hypothetical protein
MDRLHAYSLRILIFGVFALGELQDKIMAPKRQPKKKEKLEEIILEGETLVKLEVEEIY